MIIFYYRTMYVISNALFPFATPFTVYKHDGRKLEDVSIFLSYVGYAFVITKWYNSLRSGVYLPDPEAGLRNVRTISFRISYGSTICRLILVISLHIQSYK